ncbi:ABC transporter permease [Streptomyces sp. DSM 44917]|uniref:ABC transporter permease n=1 Tax=Streptomyces boetiae TaxID=3075541 RepID=A0ABU2L8W6_9ACTN|nr:ABC transporter permease [Streptomyces sp. DSM 44917]MDT0307916.1 ABC transporter permease [Streptomyces sp. DSM 44917]
MTALPFTSAFPEPAARFRDLLAAEWLKLRTLPSLTWALAVTAVLVLGFTAADTWDLSRHWTPDPGPGILLGAYRGPYSHSAEICLMLAAGSIGAMAVAGEYSTGLNRVTFAAVPARRSVMAAKAAVLAAVSTALGAFLAPASFLITQAILSAHDQHIPLTHPGAPRALLASALITPVCALTGAALATLLRHPATSVIAVASLLLLLPSFFGPDRYWSAVASHTFPSTALERLTQLTPHPVPYPWTPTGAWTVFTAWALCATLLTILPVRYRDQ